jgi:methylmalonyl-CoA/ethylmalonyl-CoA epimerase
VSVTKTVLDHVAIGTDELADGWQLFAGLLGGSWVYGGDSPGFWWGQLKFSTGPKIELLKPTGGPDAAFLERFLAARGAGPHHFNFIVPDISLTLAGLKALGIEPVRASLQDNPGWKEAFLHPKDAHGIVIQVAEQSGPPPELPAPAALPAGGPSAFALIEHQVVDLDAAVPLFADVLEGELTGSGRAAGSEFTELTWGNGARLRLVPAPPTAGGASSRPGRGGLGLLRFSRDPAPFSQADRGQAADLARRLGIPLQLG